MAAAEDFSRRRGLGRGLSALFGEEDEGGHEGRLDGGAGESVAGARESPIEFLHPGRYQPRRHFDDEALNGLVESIRAKGVLEPILARPHPDRPNAFEIIAGERRWRAAQKAQLLEMPVIVKDLEDRDALEIALVENLHREDLTGLEEAEAYQRLIDEFGYTQDVLAKSIGKSRSHVANMLRLLSLPESVRAYVADGRISAGHARTLVTSERPEALAEEIVSKGLNVREAERLAQTNRPSDAPKRGRPAKANAERDPNTVALERDLTSMLGLKVAIQSRGESGEISIQYKTLEQLDDLLQRLHGRG